MSVKVSFQSRQFWLVDESATDSALAPLEHCDAHGRLLTWDGTGSFAHVFGDEIWRHGHIIGRRSELKTEQAS